MKYNLELELSPSDVFELKRWVDEMRASQCKPREWYDRVGGRRNDFDVRLSLLEKIYKGLNE